MTGQGGGGRRLTAIMQIYLAKDGQRSGPFPLTEIRRQLQLGDLSPEVPAWREGLEAWVPLRGIISPPKSPPAPEPPPLPPLPQADVPASAAPPAPAERKPLVVPATSVLNIRIPRMTPPEAPAAPANLAAALVRTPSGFAPTEVLAKPPSAPSGSRPAGAVPPESPGLRALKAPPVMPVQLNPQAPISADELFHGGARRPRPVEKNRWPLLVNLVLLVGLAGWLLSHLWPMVPRLGWARGVTAVLPAVGVPAGAAGFPSPATNRALSGGELTATAVPAEARFQAAISEARLLMDEANWVISARRKLAEAQALRPGDPALMDVTFALEARVLDAAAAPPPEPPRKDAAN